MTCTTRHRRSDNDSIRQNGQYAEDPYERLAFFHVPFIALEVNGNVRRVRDNGRMIRDWDESRIVLRSLRRRSHLPVRCRRQRSCTEGKTDERVGVLS